MVAQSTQPGPSEADLDVFRAISDPTRRAILDRLAAEPGGMSAGSVAEGFRMSRQAVSKHLGVLAGASLVRVEQEGRERRYSANPEPLNEVAFWLARQKTALAARLVAIKEHAEHGHKESANTVEDHNDDHRD